MKSQFFPNRVVWQFDLAIGLSHEFKPRANGLASLGLLSCSATVSMTLQLPCILHACANFGGLPVASHPRVQPRVSASLHNLEHFFTLFHSLPLHDSHLNTGLLIAKIQANLAWNKANKMVDKIQPYKNSVLFPFLYICFLACFMVLCVMFSIFALLFSLHHVCVLNMHTSLCYYASLNACSDDHLLCYVFIVVISL